HCAGRDVLPAFDRDLADPAIDPRRDVEPGRIDLALHQQGFGPHEVPNREACDGGYDEVDDDGRSTCRAGPRVRWWFPSMTSSISVTRVTYSALRTSATAKNLGCVRHSNERDK